MTHRSKVKSEKRYKKKNRPFIVAPTTTKCVRRQKLTQHYVRPLFLFFLRTFFPHVRICSRKKCSTAPSPPDTHGWVAWYRHMFFFFPPLFLNRRGLWLLGCFTGQSPGMWTNTGSQFYPWPRQCNGGRQVQAQAP